MKHPMAAGFVLGWLAYNYMLLVVYFTKQEEEREQKEKEESAKSNTVSVEMTRGEYMQFRSYMNKKAEEPKKTMGFARVLNSEETDNKDEEMA